MRLVADIGGTNARIGLSLDGVIDAGSVQRFANDDWDRLDDMLRSYCQARPHVDIHDMVVAVAGPVQAGSAKLTNRNWQINATGLMDQFSCKQVHLLNDLTALGHAVPSFDPRQMVQICGDPAPTAALRRALVVGIGTGFNISQVITTKSVTICPPAEAGHVSMPVAIASRLRAFGCDPATFPTVETLFSGRGFTAFCRQMTGSADITGADAIDAYTDGANATQAVDAFATLMGYLLRDLSLTYMPSHGIFLAGSVARAVASTAPAPLIDVLQSPCSFRTQDKPSIYIAQDDGAALSGCANFTI
ncbi:glucokinase [Pseudooctadecabacter sp.]|uniref:glucokinase n=1 Tax=Pseudooctadecabacter sp. TaxID=1966338 RepID=UPI0035C8401E